MHAGLIPGVELQDQTVATMVTVREVDPLYQDTSSGSQDVTYAQHLTQKERRQESQVVRGKPIPWASVWKGPNRVIFGHDAKRGLQLYGSEWATGIRHRCILRETIDGNHSPGASACARRCLEGVCPDRIVILNCPFI